LFGRGREKTQNGIETKLPERNMAVVGEVEAGRKPRTGLKPELAGPIGDLVDCRGREKTQNGIETGREVSERSEPTNVEAGRKPRTGLKRRTGGRTDGVPARRGREKTQNGIETVIIRVSPSVSMPSRQGENPERD